MLIAGIIVLGIGALVCTLGIIFSLIGKSPYSMQTQGTVVGMCMNAYSFNNGGFGNISALISSGSSGTGTRCPVFEYMVNGIVYRRANPFAYNVSYVHKMLGQQRMIYYDPKRPERASLSKNSVFHILGIVFISIGAVMVLIGSVLVLFR